MQDEDLHFLGVLFLFVCSERQVTRCYRGTYGVQYTVYRVLLVQIYDAAGALRLWVLRCSYAVLRVLGLEADHPNCVTAREWVCVTLALPPPPLLSSISSHADMYHRSWHATTLLERIWRRCCQEQSLKRSQK